MNFKIRTIEALRKNGAALSGKFVLAGLDGFVDKIVVPVALRHSQGTDFTPIATIPEFGQRILAAAGKSTNIELYPRLEKLGGNGPIMGNALLAAGAKLKYIGALGELAIHPALSAFAAESDALSLCDPGVTTAVEFTDGKLMLGVMTSLDSITYEKILEKIGGEKSLLALFSRADLTALLNWTMIPNMTSVFEKVIEKILPKLPGNPRRFFFDLADPEKRSAEDLRKALDAISRFEKFGQVTLGLNLKEAQHVHSLLGFPPAGEAEEGLREMAAQIRHSLGLSTVVVHPRESAACATAEGSFWVPGPFCEAPLITTGAGDHFNAGFSVGQLLDLTPESCLTAGVATSGHYVRTGKSPTLTDLEQMLISWK